MSIERIEVNRRYTSCTHLSLSYLTQEKLVFDAQDAISTIILQVNH